MPYELPAESGRPSELLPLFLRQTFDFLKELIFDPQNFGLRFIIDIQEQISAAFTEETTRSFEFAERQLGEIPDREFDAVGLSGYSLTTKFSALNQLSSLVRKGAKKAIEYLLSLVNSILGSLGKLTLFADAIQEMKDLIENTTDFVTDWD